jgi:hypothetical protein
MANATICHKKRQYEELDCQGTAYRNKEMKKNRSTGNKEVEGKDMRRGLGMYYVVTWLLHKAFEAWPDARTVRLPELARAHSHVIATTSLKQHQEIDYGTWDPR